MKQPMGKAPEFIDVIIRNKNLKSANPLTVSSGQIQSDGITVFSASELETVLPSGVSSLSGYTMMGITETGFLSSKSIAITYINANTPTITILNPSPIAQNINANYLQIKVRYKKN